MFFFNIYIYTHKYPHFRCFGPKNLSLNVWLFHSTRRSAEVINMGMKDGFGHSARTQQLNFSFNFFFSHMGITAEHKDFFSILSLSLNGFKTQVKSGASSFPLSAVDRKTQHRWTPFCHKLTHWRHLLIAAISLLFRLVLYAA